MKKITLLLAVFLAFMMEGRAQLLTQDFNTALTWVVGHPVGTSTNAGWTRETSGSYPVATPFGSGMAMFNAFSINVENSFDLTSPSIAFAGGAYRVTFKMYRDDGYIEPVRLDNISVFYNTTATSVGGTLLGTVNRATTAAPVVPSNGWYTYSFNIPGTPTGPGYISFLAKTAYGNDMYIDDVVVELQPTCLQPTALTATALTASSATIEWVASTSTPANGYEYIVSTSSTAPTATSTPTGAVAAGVVSKALTGLPASTLHYFWVRSVCSSSDSSAWSSGTFRTQASCLPPTSLATTNLTATATDITWTASTSGAANGYEYIVSTTSTAPTATSTPTGAVAAGITSKSLTALPQGTAHYFWVRSVCSTTDRSTWASGTFTTPCSVLTPTVTETFATFPPACWTRSGAGNIATGPTGTGTGSWAADGFLNVGSTGAVKINLYSTGYTGWLITPVINMSAGNYRAKFKVGATMYGATTPVAAMGSDDVFVFAASQDGGTTWTAINTWNTANTPTNTGSLYVANLPSYTSATTKFAFFGTSGTVNDNLDYDLFVDDFTVETIPTCEAPINVRTSGVTATAATITWDAVTGSAGYEYVIDNVATNPTGAGTVSSGTTFTTTTLTGGTLYYVHVRNNCGTEYSAWTTFSFTTLPAPPANDNCADATTLLTNANFTCTNIVSATLAGATASGESVPTPIGNPNNDVWFKFVATSAKHRITLSDVQGTPTDLVHELLGGSCGGGLYSINISDPNVSNLTDLTIGETYYVRVFTSATVTNPSTTFKICIGTPPGPPANDNCSGAVVLTVNSGTTCTVKGTGTLESASDSGVVSTLPLLPVGTPNDDVWYSFVATSVAHTITLSNIAGDPTDLVNEIFQGTCAGLVSLKISDPNTNVVTGLTPGSTYYVRVYSYASTAGASTSFDICITSQTPPAVPANNEVAGAIALTLNASGSCAVTRTGTTIGATQSVETAPSCNATGISDDVWYSFVATEPKVTFTFTGLSTGITMASSLYTGTPGSLTEVAGNCLAGNVQNFTGLTIGTTYYARVFTQNPNPTVASAFTLCAAATPTPPANDNCADATLLVAGATLTCTSPTAGTTVGATQSLAGCTGVADDDVWYKFVATSTIHSIIVANATGSGTADIVTQVFDACGGGSLVCQDTPNSPVSLTGLAVGNTYFFRIYSAADVTRTTFTVCVGTPPPPPSNDSCATPVALTPGGVFATGAVVGTTTSASTTTGLPVPTCQATSSLEVWYSVVVPASGTLTVETKSVAGSPFTDTVLTAYTGTCAALVAINCDDDSSDDGAFSKMVLTNRTPGSTLLIAVWKYGTSATNIGQFQISAYDASLSTSTFDSASFKAYPNPVKDVLKLSYSQDMTSVSVFNLLGQQVISKSLNASDAQVDMSSLAAGTYLVKVAVDNQVKTIKVVKQ